MTYECGYKWGMMTVRDQISLHGRAHMLVVIKNFITDRGLMPNPTDGIRGFIDAFREAVKEN